MDSDIEDILNMIPIKEENSKSLEQNNVKQEQNKIKIGGDKNFSHYVEKLVLKGRAASKLDSDINDILNNVPSTSDNSIYETTKTTYSERKSPTFKLTELSQYIDELLNEDLDITEDARRHKAAVALEFMNEFGINKSRMPERIKSLMSRDQSQVREECVKQGQIKRRRANRKRADKIRSVSEKRVARIKAEEERVEDTIVKEYDSREELKEKSLMKMERATNLREKRLQKRKEELKNKNKEKSIKKARRRINPEDRELLMEYKNDFQQQIKTDNSSKMSNATFGEDNKFGSGLPPIETSNHGSYLNLVQRREDSFSSNFRNQEQSEKSFVKKILVAEYTGCDKLDTNAEDKLEDNASDKVDVENTIVKASNTQDKMCDTVENVSSTKLEPTVKRDKAEDEKRASIDVEKKSKYGIDVDDKNEVTKTPEVIPTSTKEGCSKLNGGFRKFIYRLLKGKSKDTTPSESDGRTFGSKDKLNGGRKIVMKKKMSAFFKHICCIKPEEAPADSGLSSTLKT